MTTSNETFALTPVTLSTDWEQVRGYDKQEVFKEVAPYVNGTAESSDHLWADYDASYAYKLIAANRLGLPLWGELQERVKDYEELSAKYDEFYWDIVEPAIERVAWELMTNDVELQN